MDHIVHTEYISISLKVRRRYDNDTSLQRYIKPLWLIEEEKRLQTQLRELQGEEPSGSRLQGTMGFLR